MNALFGRVTGLLVKGVISVGLIAYLITEIGIEQIWERTRHVDFVWLVVATAFLFLQVLFLTVRWRTVIAAITAPPSFNKLFAALYFSVFANLVSPASVGSDAVRVWLLKRQGVPVSISLSSVVLDRLIAILSLILLVAVSQSLFATRFDKIAPFGGLVTFLALALFGVLVVLGYRCIPEKWRQSRPMRMLARMAQDTACVLGSVKTSAIVLGWATGVNLLYCLSVYFLVLALDRSLMTFVETLVLVPAVVLISSLPISISGWGVREATMIFFLGLVGVSADTALSLSLLMGLQKLVVGAFGCLFWPRNLTDLKRFTFTRKQFDPMS